MQVLSHQVLADYATKITLSEYFFFLKIDKNNVQFFAQTKELLVKNVAYHTMICSVS